MPYMLMRVEVTHCVQCGGEFGPGKAYGHSGLCCGCAGAAWRRRRHASLGTEPPRKRDDVLTEYRHLRDAGALSPEIVAGRLGMSRIAFERCMLRARKSGDPRAADWKGWTR